MTPLQLRPTSLDEIIFEGRNKAYGAFDLRQSYPVHLRRALIIAIALLALMAGVPMVSRLLWPTVVAPPVLTDPVELTPEPTFQKIEQPKPVPAEPMAAAPKVPTIEVRTHVVPNEQVRPQPEPAVEEPIDAMPSTTTSTDGAGGVAVDGRVGDPNSGSETGTGTTATPAPAVVEPTVFSYAEKMPEFIGGQEAMVKFLRRNMHYPAQALKEGIEGKVFVAFTVSATGDIIDVEVIKGLGYGTDEEALRVVKKMPRWQAGAQNGRAVAVRYTLPITFTYAD